MSVCHQNPYTKYAFLRWTLEALSLKGESIHSFEYHSLLTKINSPSDERELLSIPFTSKRLLQPKLYPTHQPLGHLSYEVCQKSQILGVGTNSLIVFAFVTKLTRDFSYKTQSILLTAHCTYHLYLPCLTIPHTGLPTHRIKAPVRLSGRRKIITLFHFIHPWPSVTKWSKMIPRSWNDYGKFYSLTEKRQQSCLLATSPSSFVIALLVYCQSAPHRTVYFSPLWTLAARSAFW